MTGANANLAVLLVYILFTAGALATWVTPSVAKLIETTRIHKEADPYNDGHLVRPSIDEETGRDIELGELRTSNKLHDTCNEIMTELQAGTAADGIQGDVVYIIAQTASLEAQKALLQAFLMQGV